MTVTGLEVIDLSDYEFDIPCEHSQHEAQGNGAARWYVTLGVWPCGEIRPGMCCDGCLMYMKTSDKAVKCACEMPTVIYPYRRALLAVEPISPKGSRT